MCRSGRDWEAELAVSPAHTLGDDRRELFPDPGGQREGTQHVAPQDHGRAGEGCPACAEHPSPQPRFDRGCSSRGGQQGHAQALGPGRTGVDLLRPRRRNVGLSDQDWVNELVYIGLHILPVYPLALAGDVLILNTITYWTGKDTINDPGPFPGFKKGD